MGWNLASPIGFQLGWPWQQLSIECSHRPSLPAAFVGSAGASLFKSRSKRCSNYSIRGRSRAEQYRFRHYRRGQCLMGVKGLYGYVQKHFAGAAPVERLRKGDTLAIDGAGWVFEMLQGERVDHGGDYDALHETILREAERLRSAGLRLKVFKDGRVRQMKEVTMSKRRDNISLGYGRLYGYTLDGGGEGRRPGAGDADGPDLTVQNFPVPKMAIRQFYASLRSAGVEVVTCVGEADQLVAKESAEDPTGRTFALGADSDYHVFRGCRYIHFDQLKVEDDHAEAPVWTRARLAELCDLPEEQVVEWALAMGNDYTRDVSLKMLNVPKSARSRPAEALRWITSQDPDFKIQLRDAKHSGSSSSALGDEDQEGEYDNIRDDSTIEEEDEQFDNLDDASAELNEEKEEWEAREDRKGTSKESIQVLAAPVMSPSEAREAKDQQIRKDLSEATDAQPKLLAEEVAKKAAAKKAKRVAKAEKAAKAARRDALLAIEYSRALYALEPLYEFPQDSSGEEAGGSETGLAREGRMSGKRRRGGLGLPPGLAASSVDDEGESRSSENVRYTAGEVGQQDNKRTPEAELEANLLERPFGEVALEAVLRTLTEEEADRGEEGRVYPRPEKYGGVSDAVEAGARRAALWGVALGKRMALPDTVRVRWEDILLSLRYQRNLIDAYQYRGMEVGSLTGSINTTATWPTTASAAAALVTGHNDSTQHAQGQFPSAVDASNDCVNGSIVIPMPRDHFHGPTFHALLHDYRRRHHAADLPRKKITSPSSSLAEEAGKQGKEGGSGASVGNGGALPIDAHQEEILEQVRNHRVTVIHGETGCGKSSRMPVMLLEDGKRRGESVQMFVSQPRRAAARALFRRVSEDDGMSQHVAMRLGHGTRQGVRDAKISFVTTGYLVRLLANYPDALKSHTHLIIDEVHERSIDTDLLCFMAKRLLETHPNLRLVLMSATMSTALIRGYFSVDSPALFVGARRFPIKEVYVDDLAKELNCQDVLGRTCESVVRITSNDNPPNPKVTVLQHNLAVQVARAVGTPGSAVLVFVPGMASILAIMDVFDKITSTDVTYKVIPFHSDLPLEDLMTAFDPAGEGVVKVIVATNTAESSITLPDVDHVICFGTCKQMRHDPRTGRSTLTPVWISKASAVQRSGRTGRVRPGTVYKLYSKIMGEVIMNDHEAAEIRRLPLDSVVVELKNMMGDRPVVPVLESTLEPPDTSSVARSFESLYALGFITAPNDESTLTDTGRFASGLGVDLQLGRMVALGARLGVLAEAVAMAAILSAPSLPFRRASSLLHDDPDDYNAIVAESFLAQTVFDRGMYSDTLAALRLLREYNVWTRDGGTTRWSFCQLFSLSFTRMQHLATSVASIGRRVAMLMDQDSSPQLSTDPAFDPEISNVLRLLLTWTFQPNLLKMKPRKQNGSVSEDGTPFAVNDSEDPTGVDVVLAGPEVSPTHLDKLLPGVYPGMRPIERQYESPFYSWMYQTSSPSTVPALEVAEVLWRVALDLTREHVTSKTNEHEEEEEEEEESSAAPSRKVSRRAKRKIAILRKGAIVEALLSEATQEDDLDSAGEAAGARGSRATSARGSTESAGRTNSGRRESLRQRALRLEGSLVGNTHGAAGFAKEALAFAGVVYVDEEGGEPKGAMEQRRKSKDNRRWCLAVSREFVRTNARQLATLAGNKGAREALANLDKSEEEPVIIDVVYKRIYLKTFRSVMSRRSGCACAAMDMPMVRVDFSGASGISEEKLQEIFDVGTSFTGGRQGGASQVIRFKGGYTHTGDYMGLPMKDLPLGAKMLAAMAHGSRARKLRLWDHPEDKNEKISLGVSLKQNTWSVHELPTSVDAIASRANLDGSSSSGEGRDGEFNFDNYDSNGSNVDNGSGNKKGGGGKASQEKDKDNRKKSVVFGPASSIAASAMYQGGEEVFAVAGSVMWLPQGNAIADSLTLLPPGRQWLWKALVCTGKFKEGDLPKHVNFTATQAEVAEQFASTFWNSTSFSSGDNHFRQHLQVLFAKECGVDTTLAATEAAPIVTDNEKRQTIGDELGDRGAVEGDKDDDEDEDEEEEDEEDDSEGIETLLVDKVATAGELRALDEPPPPRPLANMDVKGAAAAHGQNLATSSGGGSMGSRKGVLGGDITEIMLSTSVRDRGSGKPLGRRGSQEERWSIRPVVSEEVDTNLLDYDYDNAPPMIVYFGGEASVEEGELGDAWDQGTGSPLSMLRLGDDMWGGADKVQAVRAAEAQVGEAARKAAAKRTHAEARRVREKQAMEDGENDDGGGKWVGSENEESQEVIKMDPEVGKALMNWSNSLRAAGRPMAGCLALQAVVLGILNAHRQTCLLRPRPHESSSNASSAHIAGSNARTGAGDGFGATVGGAAGGGTDTFPACERYGTFDRLCVEFREATGRAATLSEWWAQSLTDNPDYTLRAFLDGIPWLTRDEDLAPGGLYLWTPPVEVALALDGAADDVGRRQASYGSRSPTAWLSGLGWTGIDGRKVTAAAPVATEVIREEIPVDGTVSQGNRNQEVYDTSAVARSVEEDSEEDRLREEKDFSLLWWAPEHRHPCLKQFVTYLAYRDDVDLASALHRVGYTNSAWLVLGRIVASAAALRELEYDMAPRQARAMAWHSSSTAAGTERRSDTRFPQKTVAGVTLSKRVAGGHENSGRGMEQPGSRPSEDEEREELFARATDLAGIPVVTLAGRGRGDGGPSVDSSNAHLKSDDLVDITPGLSDYGKPGQKRVLKQAVGFSDGKRGEGETQRGTVSGLVAAEEMYNDGIGGEEDTGIRSCIPKLRIGGNGNAGTLATRLMLMMAREQQQQQQQHNHRQPRGGHDNISQQGFYESMGLIGSRPYAYTAHFEAARFLMDLHCGAPIPSAIASSSGRGGGDSCRPSGSSIIADGGMGDNAEEDEHERSSGIDRQACLDLVVASVIRLCQERGRMHMSPTALRNQLSSLIGMQMNDWDTMVAAANVPGVSRRKGDGFFSWEFQPDAVQAVLGDRCGEMAGAGAGEASCDADENLTQLRGFITRTFKLDGPQLSLDLAGLFEVAAEPFERCRVRSRAAKALMFLVWGSTRASSNKSNGSGNAFRVFSAIARWKPLGKHGPERINSQRLASLATLLAREDRTKATVLLVQLLVLRVVILTRRQGITRVTVDEIVSGFRTLTGFSLTKEGIEDMTGRDLLPDNGNEGGDSIRALLRRAPGLTEDEDGLYSYTHDPQGIADALGDPSEIMGWRDMVMGACDTGIAFSTSSLTANSVEEQPSSRAGKEHGLLSRAGTRMAPRGKGSWIPASKRDEDSEIAVRRAKRTSNDRSRPPTAAAEALTKSNSTVFSKHEVVHVQRGDRGAVTAAAAAARADSGGGRGKNRSGKRKSSASRNKNKGDGSAADTGAHANDKTGVSLAASGNRNVAMSTHKRRSRGRRKSGNHAATNGGGSSDSRHESGGGLVAAGANNRRGGAGGASPID